MLRNRNELLPHIWNRRQHLMKCNIYPNNDSARLRHLYEWRWVVVALPKHYFHIILFACIPNSGTANRASLQWKRENRKSPFFRFFFFFCSLKQNNEAGILNQNRLCTINQTKPKNGIAKCENGGESGRERDRTPSVRAMYYCYYYFSVFLFSVGVHVVALLRLRYIFMLHNFFYLSSFGNFSLVRKRFYAFLDVVGIPPASIRAYRNEKWTHVNVNEMSVGVAGKSWSFSLYCYWHARICEAW